MRDHQKAINNWHSMINNATPAENKVKTPIIPPTEERPTIEEKLDEIIEQVESITNMIIEEEPKEEPIKEYKRKNKNADGEEQQ